MTSPTDLRLTFVRFADGERYPVLLRAGMPEWYPTLFATTRYRNASKAPNTTYSALSAIRQVHRWAEGEGVHLLDRFRRREFLADHEISSLAAFLRRTMDKNRASVPAGARRTPSLTRLEDVRAPKVKSAMKVTSGFAYSRITYATEYLDWLARRVVQDAAKHLDHDTKESIKLMAGALRQLRPKGGRKTGLGAKMAQPVEEERLFLELAKADHPSNPFTAATAARNYLIAQMLHELGLRGGELLACKTTDFDLAGQTVVVERRHNDPEDSRDNQPVAKTDDRLLPISDELASLAVDYIVNHRKKLQRARGHRHLLVSTRDSRAGKAGDQLSRQALAKVIASLSERMPDGSQHVHPHILRHNAASRMARYLYDRGDSEAKIEDSLNAKFGWAHGSGTARIYIDRVIRSLAADAQRAMQRDWKAQRGDTRGHDNSE